MTKKIVCLMGPTASRKSESAFGLINKLPCEIISVDSAMIYRGMNIGTAKPTTEELKQAPHRLIDIRDPSEAYSAADFCSDAKREIETIFAIRKTPLLVGGTMLYFRALQQGLSSLPAADETTRQFILDKANRLGWQALHDELAKIDPATAKRIHPNDPQRLSRALEIYYLTGQSLSAHFEMSKPSDQEYDFINIALLPEDRAWLHERIAKRFHFMLDHGFLEEAKQLHNRGDLSTDLPSMRAVGYRQAWAYLENDISYEQFVEQGIAATRQLAKRQITWLRSWPNLQVIPCDKTNVISKCIDTCLSATQN